MDKSTDSKIAQRTDVGIKAALRKSTPVMPDTYEHSESNLPALYRFRSLAKVFGGYSLLPGEVKGDHVEIQNGVYSAIQPRDYIEMMFTVDIADAEIEIQRFKKLRVKFMEGKRRRDLVATMTQITVADPTGQVSKQKAAEQYVNEALASPAGEARLTEKLKSAGYDPAVVMADAIYAGHDGIELFDRLIEQAMKKREAMLRQLYHYRGGRGGRRRGSDIIDLEPEEVITR